jgi:hypothetical protein
MKVNVVRGGGFGGAVRYVSDKKKGAEHIGGTMMGITSKELIKEFGTVRELRPEIEKPVWHCSLSLPKGERLESEKWETITSDFMNKMGFSDLTPYTVFRHKDTEYDHVHIVASRIDATGELWQGRWEAKHAINASQSLEKKYDLTITPGLENEGKAKKSLKKNEIERAARTGERPARLDLQELIDDTLQKPCTAVEFCERLELSGVSIRPNIAKTGRMNGFSFEFKGVAFKGSSLGADYKWKKLQERGVTYEQVRDGQELTKRKEHFSGVSQSVARDQRGIEKSTTSDLERSGSPGGIGTEGRRDHAGPTVSNQSDSGGYNLYNIHPIDNDSQRHQQDSGSNREPDSTNFRIETTHNSDDNSSSRSREESKEDHTSVVGENSHLDIGGIDRGNERGGWAKGFRVANAAKRNSEKQRSFDETTKQSRTRGNRFNERDHKQVSPLDYLNSHGFNVKKEGRHYSVTDAHGDEHYRLTHKESGDWLWCDHYGNTGGDNLDLVKDIEPTLSYIDRVYKLQSVHPTVTTAPVVERGNKRRPKLPEETEARQGRRYLQKRGINPSTIKEAESQGFLKYCSGGILFCGFDRRTGELASVTKRATSPTDAVQKKDLYGTDKNHPSILKGNGTSVWFVEGGVDALALHDLTKQQRGQDGELPTVVVTGGARVYSCLRNEHVKDLVRKSSIAYLAYENESTPAKQQITDAGHNKQRAILKEETGREVKHWQQHEGVKDLAELNALVAKNDKSKTLSNERDRGMSM